MAFGISYEKTVFFIGMAVVLFALSETKTDQTPKQQSKLPILGNDNLLHSSTDSTLESTAIGNTPTPFETTLTTANTVPVLSKDSAAPSKLPPPNSIIQSLFLRVKCEHLKNSYFARELVDIFSPEIFSQIDPFRYLVDKTMKIEYKRISWLRDIIGNHLQYDQLPRCYVPYARTLSSLFRYWPDMDNAADNIKRFQKVSLKIRNDFDPSLLPSNISVPPQLLELFSREIFTDPTPPLGIFYKLVDMPKIDILNLKAQLQKFIEQTNELRTIPFKQKFYYWYADNLRKFLQDEAAFDELKRNMAEIQRLATESRADDLQ